MIRAPVGPTLDVEPEVRVARARISPAATEPAIITSP
ncbi:MAG: hypothetical protein QOG74_3435 [Alphaproteobacteria bacterium]|nr:hypothetical protein [Alphaproteobacteria bacterium]